MILSKARSELILGYPQQQRKKGPYITTRGIISGSSTLMRKPTGPLLFSALIPWPTSCCLLLIRKFLGPWPASFTTEMGSVGFVPGQGEGCLTVLGVFWPRMAGFLQELQSL